MIKLFKKQLEYYKTIDELPVWNWFKIQTSNDASYMMINRRENLSPVERNLLTLAFDKVYSEFIDTYGINPQLEEVLVLKRDIEVLRADMILTNDKSLINFIKIKQLELNGIIERKNKGTQEEVTGFVEKYMGFAIDMHKVSVKQFYAYMELMKKEKRPKQ